jgi:membrane protease YdiL (CAAX protease family)
MFAIVSIAVIIGICYSHCRNLFVPIWIHFMNNFSLTMFVGETLDVITWLAVCYTLVALGYVIWDKRYSKKADAPIKQNIV